MKDQLTKEFLESILSYDKDSGIFIWKRRNGSTKSDNIFNALKAGKIAGSISKAKRSKTKYLHIEFGGKIYKAHRLAFIFMGEPLPKQVDHIDHNGLNNKWENLRASDSIDNSRNRPMQKSNKTGVVGVNWHKAAKKWQVRAVNSDGERVDLGRYVSFDDAVRVRKEYEKKFKYYENRDVKNV